MKAPGLPVPPAPDGGPRPAIPPHAVHSTASASTETERRTVRGVRITPCRPSRPALMDLYVTRARLIGQADLLCRCQRRHRMLVNAPEQEIGLTDEPGARDIKV